MTDTKDTEDTADTDTKIFTFWEIRSEENPNQAFWEKKRNNTGHGRFKNEPDDP